MDNDDFQISIDPVSDERAWCMFVSGYMASCESPVKEADHRKALSFADEMLKEFKIRFRQEGPLGSSSGGDDDDDDDSDDEDD
jgi:hypothetical protein